MRTRNRPILISHLAAAAAAESEERKRFIPSWKRLARERGALPTRPRPPPGPIRQRDVIGHASAAAAAAGDGRTCYFLRCTVTQTDGGETSADDHLPTER